MAIYTLDFERPLQDLERQIEELKKVTGDADLTKEIAALETKLSERRAQSVRQYLIGGGLPAERLLAEGMGLRDPRYPNTREGRPKNRRVDIEFVTY